jgi:ribosome maturation protein SDO1
MSAKMQVPLNQVRHSNVAVVKLTRNGVKLEIACYKNKVLSFRGGLETRLDEVMQIDRIFTNVSRGSYASDKDINTAMGTTGSVDPDAVIKYILEHGELQIAQQERTSEIDEMIKDIANVVSQKCVHVATGRPFPPAVIEQSLRSIGVAVKLDQPIKKQALAFIKQLIDSGVLPIRRALMKLRCCASSRSALQPMIDWCAANGATVVEDDAAAASSAQSAASIGVFVMPHLFRDVDAVARQCGPGAVLDVIENSVTETGEGAANDIATELEHVNMNEDISVNGRSCAPESIMLRASVVPRAGVSKEKKAEKKKKKSSADGDNSSTRDSKPAVPSVGDDTDDDDDDDDDSKRKKKKKLKSSSAPTAETARKKQPPPPPTKMAAVNEEDEDDVISERKKKKNSKAAAVTTHRDEEEDFDYGDDYGDEPNVSTMPER